uniref:DNA replication licensing factor MCM3 n=1 Tax=Hirondellea gigas TaxID=1518452 RepID=A0A6A7G7J6_9CRUS
MAAPLEFENLKRRFADILDDDNGEGNYAKKVDRMVEEGQTRLIVNINELQQLGQDGSGHGIAAELRNRPINAIPPMEAALNDFVRERTADVVKKTQTTYCIGMEGFFGANRILPRELHSRYLTKLVCVEGIVAKASFVLPKRVKTVHYCEETKMFSEHVYRDATTFSGQPTSSAIPRKDEEGRDLKLEFGYSTYENYQKVFIQDMPERSSAGQMPRTIEICVEKDLVDACKAGDRVQVIGVYRALAWKISGTTSGMFRTVVIANNIRKINQELLDESISGKVIGEIRKISERKDVLELFGRSMAPSLYGHEFIKKALVLLLLGGEEKVLENGTHIRGDINMLILGDPSTGKSQLLRYVMNVAKSSISTTGRGASGVGLTAAVVTDKDTGERYLEAGAMVLGDRGIVCIDEFDKMSEIDRTAIHEVMEQQTVTIAKAGIHTSLNARCSVVAAANPMYSSYDPEKTAQQNIALPDSILSRFDFLFLVLDKLDPESDRNIAEHVLRMHRYNRFVPDDAFDSFAENDSKDDTLVFEKYDRLLHGWVVTDGKRSRPEYLTIEFCKKFFLYAKKKVHPVLGDNVVEFISKSYASLRNDEQVQTLPVTARCLETLIRLSTAHAKLRLSKTVEQVDCDVALEILQFSLNSDAQIKSNQKPMNAATGGDDMSDDDNDDDNDDGKHDEKNSDDYEISTPSDSSRKRPPSHRGKASPTPQKRPRHGSQAVPVAGSQASSSSGQMDISDGEEDCEPVTVTKERKQEVMKVISKLTRRQNYEISVAEILKAVNTSSRKAFSKAETNAILKVLEQENKVMLSDNLVHRI